MTELVMKRLIKGYIANKEMDKLKNLNEKAEEMELLHVFHSLSSKEQVIAFRLLSKNKALAVFEQLDTEEQKHLLQSLTAEDTIEFVNEMAPDDRVRLLDELPATVAKKLLASISLEERQVTNVLLGYEVETAGRIMTTEYISLKKDMTASDALTRVRQLAHDRETIYTLFVTDSQKRLEGVLTLKELLIANNNAILEDIMSKKAISVKTSTDQEKAAKMLQDLDLLALPVVDKEDRLVGIITVDDAMDIMQEEVTEDIHIQAGLSGLKKKEATRSKTLIAGTIWQILKVRLPILILVLAGGFLAGFIVQDFEGVLEEVTAVAFFIPLIMDMGGSVGGQSTTIFARGSVLGDIKAGEFFKQLGKESFVGFSIGTIVAFFSFFAIWLWLGDPMIALAVSLALIANCLIAAFFGFLVPFFLIKIGADQAAGSGPIITSIKDISGLLVYFMLVSVLLQHLLN